MYVCNNMYSENFYFFLLVLLSYFCVCACAAMSFPASGVVESAYRNNLKDVAKMLQTKHQNNYMVCNIQSLVRLYQCMFEIVLPCMYICMFNVCTCISTKCTDLIILFRVSFKGGSTTLESLKNVIMSPLKIKIFPW